MAKKRSKVHLPSASAKRASASSGGDSISTSFFILAPLLGVFILLLLGGVFFILRGNQEPVVVKNDNRFIATGDDDNDEPDFPTNQDNGDDVTPTPASTTPSGNNSTLPPTPKTTEEITPTPKDSGDVVKIEKSSASFLRNISFNNSKAFLTSKPISIVNSKVNQLKTSGALAENIRNAKKGASQIKAMAESKNLKPLFLAVAALAKLGNQSGDVVATAQSMLDTLDNLSIVLGNELANDNLLVIAAFDQGVAGQNLVMRDMLARLTKEFPNKSSREIRTIWFLKENGKISESQFEFALRFLAIGTITQNPKDFNVQAEGLTF